jgi:hypothetical protein
MVTPAAAAALRAAGDEPANYLVRHQRCDPGDLCPEDVLENEIATQQGLRVVSIFSTALRQQLVLVSESDRSVTTIMLPEEQ